MKRIVLVFSLLLLLAFHFSALAAPGQPASPAAADSSTALCLPGIYLDDPGDCLPGGPSAYYTEMSELGITFPMTSVVTSKPDPSLTQLDTRYGEVRNPKAPVFGSIEEANNGKKSAAIQTINSSFAYISYTDEAVVDGKRFYMIQPSAWMRANDISRLGAVPLFQGLLIRQTPDHAFGWVINYRSPDPVQSKRTPGYQLQDYTGHEFKNYEIINVYGETKVNDETWFMVGPDEWLPYYHVARVIPDTVPPEGVTGDRWIEVNLQDQTLAVYDNRQLVFATLIASGLEPFWTRPGVFQISQKLESTPMTGSFEVDRSDAYYLEDVPWTMYFDNARALHGAYWRAKLGFPQSHGCVNMSVGDSHWLFDWASVGDYVYVWDPSGKTPTDPSVYSGGGY